MSLQNCPPQPDKRVAQWIEDTDDDLMHISVMTIGELCKGITVHREAHRRAWLRQWLDGELRPWFAGRILPITEAISERWGILEGECQLKGIGFNAPDGLIAATAFEYSLTVVTRNVRDFARLGVAVLDRAPVHSATQVFSVGKRLCQAALVTQLHCLEAPKRGGRDSASCRSRRDWSAKITRPSRKDGCR